MPLCWCSTGMSAGIRSERVSVDTLAATPCLAGLLRSAGGAPRPARAAARHARPPGCHRAGCRSRRGAGVDAQGVCTGEAYRTGHEVQHKTKDGTQQTPSSRPCPTLVTVTCQWPTPLRKVKVVLSRVAGKAWKNLPTGPSAGVKGSASPLVRARGAGGHGPGSALTPMLYGSKQPAPHHR